MIAPAGVGSLFGYIPSGTRPPARRTGAGRAGPDVGSRRPADPGLNGPAGRNSGGEVKGKAILGTFGPRFSVGSGAPLYGNESPE